MSVALINNELLLNKYHGGSIGISLDQRAHYVIIQTVSLKPYPGNLVKCPPSVQFVSDV